ncbi:MAG: tRNA 2-thiouridine(34) synthase MnmA [Wolinella sp.]
MKVALLMSGGVDSSYSAYLLQESGYEVVGIYLKLHNDDQKHAQNIANIDKVAQKLGIDVHIYDAKEMFKKHVYDYFIDSYKKGLTPNPCAFCNPTMKFGFALERALELGCERVATGHYARVKDGCIREAFDTSKDQSYFLFGLKESTISRLIFPLGDRLKSELKPEALAILPWLGTLESYKDSQEICFVETDYVDILRRHFSVEQRGNVKDKNGAVVGEHKGYMQYTIGKRKGFSVRGAHNPHYVLAINPAENSITVGSKDDLAKNIIYAEPFSLPGDFCEMQAMVKIRYRSTKASAHVVLLGESNQSDSFLGTIPEHLKSYKSLLVVELDELVYGVANGQALVIYNGDLVIGGGWILDSALKS